MILVVVRQIARLTITHVSFIALIFAMSRGRYMNTGPRGLLFKQLPLHLSRDWERSGSVVYRVLDWRPRGRGFEPQLRHCVVSLSKTQEITDEKTYGPQREKTCLRGFANNTGVDQPAHSRSLINAFVIRVLESIVCKLATDEISIF